MMAHMPIPQFQVVVPRTLEVMLPLTQVLMTKGKAGIKEKNSLERNEVKSAMMTSTVETRRGGGLYQYRTATVRMMPYGTRTSQDGYLPRSWIMV